MSPWDTRKHLEMRTQMNADELKKVALEWLEANKEPFHQAADTLWKFPELSMEEHNSSALLISLLEDHGFRVEKGVAGMPTAFAATYGSGHPVIGFNAEYDCLPGLSQEVGPEKKPIVAGGPGHGCGHNLLGTAAVQAAIAVKTVLAQHNLNATLKVFGTPAEELCIGKPFMARAGLFEGLDLFLDWHPWNYNRADYDVCSAYFNIRYHFKGRTAHGSSPWFGRSSLDAALLMAHAVEMLREHIPPSSSTEAANTINFTFSKVGPEIPNVVPDATTAWYVGRFETTELMVDVLKRLGKCAEGAAIATETSVASELITATHDKIPNKVLADVMHKNLEEIGPPRFTEEEQAFVKQMQRNMGVEKPLALDETIVPFGGGASVLCDTSEFSWFTPYATVWITLAPQGIGWHNWVVASCCGSSIGKKTMSIGAKVIAATALDAIMNPDIVKAAQQELKERIAGRDFVKIIPDTVNPPLDINTATMAKYR